MALNPKLSTAARNAALDAALDVLDGGFLDIYDGSQPAGPGTAVTTQTKLVRFTLYTPAFAAASGASKAAAAIPDAIAIATGTASWYRILKSDETAVADGSVGTSSSNLVLDSADIGSGATVSVTAFTFTMAPLCRPPYATTFGRQRQTRQRASPLSSKPLASRPRAPSRAE